MPPTAIDTTVETLCDAAAEAHDILLDFVDALSGGGGLTSQSVHLGHRRRYTTLARRAADRLKAAIAKCEGQGSTQ
jgi:hypothetical protein